MRRPCVRVERSAGEETREALEAAGVRDFRFEIDSDDEAVYIPLVDGHDLEATYEIVTREVSERSSQTLPEELLGFAPTYERLGDLALLQEDDPECAETVAQAIMTSDLPVTGVLNRTSKVEGTERVAQWNLLAGDTTETVHREYGASFLVDPTKAYFSPRLATERERVITQIQPDEQVFDMFAGVGPFAVRAGLAGATVIAVDINPDAVAYCRENVDRSGVADRVTVIEGDVSEVAAKYADWAERIIMNLPHTADAFLDVAARLTASQCRLHYYDIQPDDDPFTPGEQAIRGTFEPEATVRVANRRIVRSYAPGQVNVCLDVDIER